MYFTPEIIDSNPELLALRKRRLFKEAKGFVNDSRKYTIHTQEHNVGKKLIDQGLTIVHPFYNDKERFDLQFPYWQSYDDIVKQYLKITIVDDCSKEPVSSYITRSKQKRIDFNLTGYRITEDLKWNTPGALNLGIMQATTDWVLIMDSDCLLNAEMIDTLMSELSPKENWLYYFPRNRITDDPIKKLNVRFLPCAILFHKNTFKTIGGFDEDFVGARSGGYGVFDNHFEVMMGRYGYSRGILTNIVISEYIFKNETPSYTKEDVNVNLKLHYKKMECEVPMNRQLMNFTWEKSFEFERW
jgi:glycosyltransferase involved in cell wall biosynthesis